MRSKGVSYTLSVVLYCLVAVILVLTVFAFVSSFVQTQLSAIPKVFNQFVRIEAVCYKDSALYIYVRNIGKVSAHLVQVIVYKEGEEVQFIKDIDVVVKPNEVALVKICKHLPEGSYIVEVVTETGFKASYLVVID